VDDAFIKICHMVNDLSMTVRREATGLLGSLHLVSPKFLEQTLDKKLMSHLKASCWDKVWPSLTVALIAEIFRLIVPFVERTVARFPATARHAAAKSAMIGSLN